MHKKKKPVPLDAGCEICRDVKLYQLVSKVIKKNPPPQKKTTTKKQQHRIFLSLGHEFPYIFNKKGGN